MAQAKLSKELIKVITECIKDFMPIYMACKYAGINASTHCNYINRAIELDKAISDGHNPVLSEHDQLCLDYHNAIKEADAECFRQGVRSIKAHTGKDWKAAARLMEAKYPKEFGRSVNLNVQRMAQKLAEEVDIDTDSLDPPAESDDA